MASAFFESSMSHVPLSEIVFLSAANSANGRIARASTVSDLRKLLFMERPQDRINALAIAAAACKLSVAERSHPSVTKLYKTITNSSIKI
jgi:hypothetical protein